MPALRVFLDSSDYSVLSGPNGGRGADGIARVFFCTLIGRRIVMLHSFIKKSQKTPLRELEVARKRMKEMKDANS